MWPDIQRAIRPRTFWFKPVSILWLVRLTTVATIRILLALPRSLAPGLPWDARNPRLRSHDHRRRSCERGYFVPAASHRAVASAACAGRLPVMEHRVRSFLHLLSSNHHSGDFASHEHAIISEQEPAARLLVLLRLLPLESFRHGSLRLCGRANSHGSACAPRRPYFACSKAAIRSRLIWCAQQKSSRVAGEPYGSPAPSEPDLRLSPHPAQAPAKVR